MDGRGRAHPGAPAVLIGALLALLLMAPAALADDSAVGATGGTAYPIMSADIRLAAETVQAVCFGSFAEYRVDFRFVNDGEKRRVKLGFPFTDTVSGKHGSERPFGFQAWQNGRPLTVTAVRARATAKGGRNGYFVHEALFRHGATMITVSYLAMSSGMAANRGPAVRAGDPDYGLACSYQYWLHTGSTWKGPIGEAVVRYQLADSFPGRGIELSADGAYDYVPVTAPSGWTNPLPRTYQWQFSDFDPKPANASSWWRQQSDFDVTLGYADAFRRPGTKGRWTWSSAAKGFGEHKYDQLQDGMPETCWADGAPGPGVGQWLQASFKRPLRLRELRVLSGNNAYDTSFERFARPRTMTAIFSDGSSRFLRLKDAPTLQRFPVNVRTRSVRFVVRSVYLGTDYPAVCVSEVEFGRARAPGYAAFDRLIVDPTATGRLTAWAGPPAPRPATKVRRTDWRLLQDAELYVGGDLIGISDVGAFPADTATFKEPASLGALTAHVAGVRLPDPAVVGRVSAVEALSYWTYEVHFARSVDLLVRTPPPSDLPRVSLAAELVRETKDVRESGERYADGRRRPFRLTRIGGHLVGIVKPGRVLCLCNCSGDTRTIPGQVFWRAGDVTYHLYARSRTVTVHDLLTAASSIIEPGATAAGPPPSPWVLRLGAGLVAAGAAAAVIVLLRRGRETAATDPSA
jgi:hypothetical protein